MKNLSGSSKRTDLSLHWQKLDKAFYERSDVLEIARDLIGKILVTRFNGVTTAGRIVETEAYNGVTDKASHAYNGRRTRRTETMYARGGLAYIYLCYGIHHLFNVVTNVENIPHAVLIRAVEPLIGQATMLERSGKPAVHPTLTKGPGNMARALGIFTRHTGLDLTGNEIFMADDGYLPDPQQLMSTPRIGVDYAGADALLPYRFILLGSPFVSGKK